MGTPTVIFSDKPKTPANIYIGVKMPSCVISTPTIRKRIEIKITDLNKYSSNDSAKSVAVQLILVTNTDQLRLENVIKIGQDVQEEHNILLEKIVAISQNDTINQCKAAMFSILKCLETYDTNIRGFSLGGLFGKQNSPESKKEELNKHMEFLKLRKYNLGNILIDIREYIAHAKKLIADIEPYVIQTSFFVDYQKTNFPNELFLSRVTSLLTTRANIEQNILQLQLLSQMVVDLIESVDTLILAEIPLWITNSINGNINAKYQKDKIINQIKTKFKYE